MESLDARTVAIFKETVWQHYATQSRQMPWRQNTSPYYIFVSELMLQQTQVSRVIPKFIHFIELFPDAKTLANASLADVLRAWSGLGYNRRAKFLHQSAKQVMSQGGNMPNSYEELISLPGIGPNTAAAIMNYAYEKPTIFVETNIRTVFFHHFFPHSTETIDDATLRKYVDQTLDRNNPREWFWALMDYGNYLKRSAGGRLTQGRHYKKQSPLSGSIRETRGRILKALTAGPKKKTALVRIVQADERFDKALTDLQNEGLVESHQKNWSLTGYCVPS